MGRGSRWEYLKAIHPRYRQADRQGKKIILNEFCRNTGYHRKYAIRLLNGPPPGRGRPPCPPPASDADLQYASHLGVGGGLGGSRLSLRGPVEGAAALVDALDAETFSTGPGVGEASVAHQRAPDRPPAASPKEARPTPALCANRARHAAQAHDSHQDRSLAGEDARFCGSRFGLALGQFGQRRVRLFAQSD